MTLGLKASLARLDDAGTLFATQFRRGTLDVDPYRPRIDARGTFPTIF
ncbi:hypothetical protein [Burkholderia cenocepacia]|nr:hypothetical protein [Burkholderia cenocepacia]